MALGNNIRRRDSLNGSLNEANGAVTLMAEPPVREELDITDIVAKEEMEEVELAIEQLQNLQEDQAMLMVFNVAAIISEQ